MSFGIKQKGERARYRKYSGTKSFKLPRRGNTECWIKPAMSWEVSMCSSKNSDKPEKDNRKTGDKATCWTDRELGNRGHRETQTGKRASAGSSPSGKLEEYCIWSEDWEREICTFSWITEWLTERVIGRNKHGSTENINPKNDSENYESALGKDGLHGAWYITVMQTWGRKKRGLIQDFFKSEERMARM